MNIRILTLFVASILPLELSVAEESQPWTQPKHNYIPPAGYVPDSKTAILIALAVWNPIYGEDKIKTEKPYKAELKDGVWHVRGSLPKGWLGGVAEAEIDQKTCKIIRISHGK